MNFQIDLTQIVVALIGVLASVLSAYLIPLIKGKGVYTIVAESAGAGSKKVGAN